MERRKLLKNVGLTAVASAAASVSPVRGQSIRTMVLPVLLGEADRAALHRGLMRYLSPRAADFPCVGFTKTDLRAAIDATDSWIEANQASFNAALPEPFKSAAGLPLKTLLFCAVAAMRVSIGFARSIFGETD